jgi:hypothetical protein
MVSPAAGGHMCPTGAGPASGSAAPGFCKALRRTFAVQGIDVKARAVRDVIMSVDLCSNASDCQRPIPRLRIAPRIVR